MWKRLLTLTTLVVATVSCFEIQGKHTIYLDPDGAVTWTVLEEEIRFDAETRESRRSKEGDFLNSVNAGEHSAARSLAALYPSTLNSRILREETPPAILTEARFPGIDRLYQNLFDLYGAPATVELEIGEDRARLLITVWPAEADEVEGVSDEILFALMIECRIVLTEGKFVDAVGFKILDDGRAVELADGDSEDDESNATPLVLSLTWMSERGSGEAQ